MTRQTDTDQHLEDLFAQARKAPPEPDADFLSRVLADAETVQAGFAPPSSAPRSQARTRGGNAWLNGLRTAFGGLGGWPVAAGLCGVAVAGLWIGLAPPQGLADQAQTLMTSQDDLLENPEINLAFAWLEEAS